MVLFSALRLRVREGKFREPDLLLLIVATQSPQFVDAFDVDEIIVLELCDGRTVCRKLNGDEYQVWLDEFAPGQLWEKNVLGGRL